ncbi:helix-turn-helix domain-containing protein [Konateibacter massiliensis]|uniref:helix-turn-helix domain-containing protein n=1 Tax=Konateibacter massiliensis TaxID=2002841 RepID=UPI000C144F64|nr:helix-turn-helix domain-containing protein [Konateibacter massiliensis]
MDNKKMGKFIAELRKAKSMTQKDLASKLNVTDKAVSKWERGLSYPDISLLPDLANILGVTASELLNGEKSNSVSENTTVSIDNALHYADKAVKSKVKNLQVIGAAAFSFLLLAGIIVCSICDMAISGGFTWSLFPISSILFTWLVFFPVIRFGKKGIVGTMIALTILIIPFLYVIDNLVKDNPFIMPIGIRMAAISLVFLWSVFLLFKILKDQKLMAAAISFLIGIPVCFFISFSLSRIIDEPLIDTWDVLTYSILAILSIVFFLLNLKAQKK